MQNNLADIRKEYSRASLDVETVNPDPVAQFETWFGEAMTSQIIEPNAMNLATVNKDGRPSSRVVLLKGIEDKKFIFYSNYQSRKGRELDANPACALTFFWPDLERQVRIEGVAARIESKASEAYFQSRPRLSQIGAWVSPQSAVIKDRKILEERLSALEDKFKGLAILPKPNQWGGYAVDPYLIEFWQGRPGRLHDRVEYMRVENKWEVHRLAP